MEDEKFEREFNAKLTEHVRFIAGYIEALSYLTLRDKYKHMFWIRTIKCRRAQATAPPDPNVMPEGGAHHRSIEAI